MLSGAVPSVIASLQDAIRHLECRFSRRDIVCLPHTGPKSGMSDGSGKLVDKQPMTPNDQMSIFESHSMSRITSDAR
jgi:hypothetical protein